MHLLKIMLKANGRCGVPQGGVISPLLSNLYLTEVDRMLERAKEVTRSGKYTYIEYARFADDLVILIDAYPQHDWLLPAVEKRLREELAALQVEINEEKSRIVDFGRGESFGFPHRKAFLLAALPLRQTPKTNRGPPDGVERHLTGFWHLASRMTRMGGPQEKSHAIQIFGSFL